MEDLIGEGRRLDHIFRAVDGEVVGGRDIEIEVQPIVAQNLIAVRVEDGKGGDEVHFSGY